MCGYVVFFFFKQKTAYEMRISDWSSDVCSSDLERPLRQIHHADHEEAAISLPGHGAVADGQGPLGVPADRRLRPEAGFRQHLSRHWRRHGLSRVEEAKLLRPLKHLSRKGKFVSAAVQLESCGGSLDLEPNVAALDIHHIMRIRRTSYHDE